MGWKEGITWGRRFMTTHTHKTTMLQKVTF
jgi:hypothetical protein